MSQIIAQFPVQSILVLLCLLVIVAMCVRDLNERPNDRPRALKLNPSQRRMVQRDLAAAPNTFDSGLASADLRRARRVGR